MTDIRYHIDLIEQTLNELTPYRNTDEFKGLTGLIKSTPKDADPMKQIVSRINLLHDFTKMLRQKGFSSLGSGTFASVFTHPGINYAIKIFSDDPAYMAYVRFALAHQDNPHVPKFRGKFMKIDDHHYAVRMELLTTIDWDRAQQICRCIRAYVLRNSSWFDCEEEFEYDPAFAQVAQGIADIIKKNGFELDIHPGNIMTRGNTFVVTDPLIALS